VTAVRIKVRIENSTICVRLLFATRERRRGVSGCGVGASALMLVPNGSNAVPVGDVSPSNRRRKLS
jgi:hypothetical protein